MAAGTMDIYGLRKSFIEGEILICFNGPFSHSIIEEIGTAVRRYLETEDASRSAMTDVFAVFVELTQNVQAYTALLRNRKEGAGLDAGTLVIGRSGGKYAVSAGNAVDRADIPALASRLDEIKGLDKAQLKTLYKERLRAAAPANGGAGLGLIDTARRAAEPLSFSFRDMDDRYGFFSLTVII